MLSDDQRKSSDYAGGSLALSQLDPSCSPLDRFFHPALASAKLKRRPVPVQIGTESIVLFRNSLGEAVAVQDRCPHRFTPLSLGSVQNGSIVCPYHAWSVDGDGAVNHPKKGVLKNCGVKTYSVYEAHGFIWLAAKPDAIKPAPPNAEWQHLGAYSLEVKAPLHVVLDNFSEDEHFPYVHKILGWDETGIQDVEFSYAVSVDEIRVQYRGPQRRFIGMSLFLARPGDFFNNEWTTRFDPIRIAYTASLTDQQGRPRSPLRQHVAIYFVPNGTDRTTMHVIQCARFKDPKWNWILRLQPFAKATTLLTRWDLTFDKVLTEKIAGVPYRFNGMKLGEYDAPLVQGRKLLERIYYGASSGSAVGTVVDPVTSSLDSGSPAISAPRNASGYSEV